MSFKLLQRVLRILIFDEAFEKDLALPLPYKKNPAYNLQAGSSGCSGYG